MCSCVYEECRFARVQEYYSLFSRNILLWTVISCLKRVSNIQKALQKYFRESVQKRSTMLSADVAEGLDFGLDGKWRDIIPSCQESDYPPTRECLCTIANWVTRVVFSVLVGYSCRRVNELLL